ncbi:MAG: RNA pseudouridine synthase, partial [Spirochaetae bacterium HGW-Spirochaetae-9]
DDDVLAANKLAPLPVLKDKSGDEDLQSMIMREHPEHASFLEAAHRIDRRTSGIVVFAKNAAALRKLEESFRERGVRKTYIACLEKEPVPAEGVLNHMIIADSRRNISVARPMALVAGAEKDHQGAVQAELAYKLLMKTERYFFVEAKPLTGRHHQIRAQFAAMGWSIKGDLKYGAKRSSQSGRIMLHGWRTEFAHPRTGEALVLTADFPTDETLWKVFADFIATAGKSAGDQASV